MSRFRIRRLVGSALGMSRIAPRPRRLSLHELESRLTPAFAATIGVASTTVAEGSDVALTSTVTDATTPTYQWTVVKEGVAGDFATGTTANFDFTPDDNGTYDVTLVVTDTGTAGNPTTTATVTINAFNVPPTASVSGPSTSVPGLPLTFTLNATDSSTVDTAAGFTFNIDWDNNGSVDQTVSGPSGTTVTHTFGTTGSDTFSVTATDKDGGTSAPVTQTVTVQTVAVVPDQLNPGKTLLAVGGTAGDDNIMLVPAGSSGKLKVTVNGQQFGNFGPVSRIAVYGLDGNDNIQLAGSIRTPAWLFGGDGNDRLQGAKGNDVLVGGAGDDDINGKQGDDIVIGGEGSDHILGGPGNDLMIGGSTAYDANEPALFAIATIWRTGSVASRVSALQTSTTVPLVLGGSTPTVFDDGVADFINGTSGGGWIFGDPGVDQIGGSGKGIFFNDGTTAGNGHGHGNGNGNGGGNGNGHGNGHGNH